MASDTNPVVVASKILEGSSNAQIGREMKIDEHEISEITENLPIDLNMKVEKAFTSLLRISLKDFKKLRLELLEIINEKDSDESKKSGLIAIKTLLNAELSLVDMFNKIRVKKEENRRKKGKSSVWNDVYERAKANGYID